MTVGVERIVEAAAAALGPCRFVADLSWPHGESVVVEIETASGQRVIGKAHRQDAKYAAEKSAYQQWVPSIGDRAPRLIAGADETQVLIVTKLDAAHVGPAVDLVDVHRQAGSLLARFHAAAVPTELTGFARDQRIRLEAWVARAAPGVLGDDEIDFVARQLAVLDDLPDPIGVSCHRDWQPRNWLIGDDGRLVAIDFEHARIGPWFEDLMRLRWDEWLLDQRLAEAFFDGYGRRFDDAESRTFMAISVLGHLCTIVWSHEHDDQPFADFGRRSLAEAIVMTRRPIDQWWPATRP